MDIEPERWELIFDGYYEVSDWGNLRRAKPGISTFIGRPVKALAGPTGYQQVQLQAGKVKRRAYVHHIVAEAFIGPRPEGFVVNHKDMDRQNNQLDNLEYVTSAANSQHYLKLKGRPKGPTKPKAPLKGKQIGDRHWSKRMPERIARGDRMPHSKLTPEMVKDARRRVANGESQTSVAKEMNVCVAQMSRIIRGTRWTYL